MGIGRCSKPLRGVGVYAIPDAGWIQINAVSLCVMFLRFLVCDNCLYPVWQCE
jgi:hypothetical protein